MHKKSPLLIICGPTASGKSRFAMNAAEKLGGVIINIDAIQVYKEIPILTCSPSEKDKLTQPHYLYNFLSVTENYSVSRYIDDAIATLNSIKDKIPILVGGSGLYIKSLCNGLSSIPQIPIKIRESLINKMETIGKENFYQELQNLDPLAASKLHPSNTQRLIRAYEVFMHTGKSLYDFHEDATLSPLAEYDIKTLVLTPERKFLYSLCNERFRMLMNTEAIHEVESVISKNIAYSAAEKAIGFKEIASYIKGEINKEEAIISAQTKTRQYAKRQVTWFNHQLSDAIRIEFDENTKGILDHSIPKLW